MFHGNDAIGHTRKWELKLDMEQECQERNTVRQSYKGDGDAGENR